MTGYLTPDTTPTESICRRLFIPDNEEFIAVVTGALNSLAEPHNWTQFGALTPEQAAEALYDMLDQFSIDGQCEVELPEIKACTLWHQQSRPIGAADLQTVIDVDQWYNTRTSFVSPINGHSFEQGFYLAAGTYVFTVQGFRNNNQGRVQWYVDDVPFGGLFDFYAAAIERNYQLADTVTVTDGWHTLKGVITGKNALSSAFQISLTKMWFYEFIDE